MMRFARMGSLAMMFQWNGLIFVVGNLDGKSGVQILAVEKTNNGKEYLRVFHEGARAPEAVRRLHAEEK